MEKIDKALKRFTESLEMQESLVKDNKRISPDWDRLKRRICDCCTLLQRDSSHYVSWFERIDRIHRGQATESDLAQMDQSDSDESDSDSGRGAKKPRYVQDRGSSSDESIGDDNGTSHEGQIRCNEQETVAKYSHFKAGIPPSSDASKDMTNLATDITEASVVTQSQSDVNNLTTDDTQPSVQLDTLSGLGSQLASSPGAVHSTGLATDMTGDKMVGRPPEVRVKHEALKTWRQALDALRSSAKCAARAKHLETYLRTQCFPAWATSTYINAKLPEMVTKYCRHLPSFLRKQAAEMIDLTCVEMKDKAEREQERGQACLARVKEVYGSDQEGYQQVHRLLTELVEQDVASLRQSLEQESKSQDAP